jgi:phosphoglycolate phosphatase-like HAD superfamily hydrolase
MWLLGLSRSSGGTFAMTTHHPRVLVMYHRTTAILVRMGKPMVTSPTVFIDDGGVMNDNERRGAQWQQLVGEFLAPLLGGSPAAWGEANRVVATALFEDYRRTMSGRDDADFNEWLYGNRIAWTRCMCERVGVPVPGDEECAALARQASEYVTPRIRAAFPGVVGAIRMLHSNGHRLYTASGEDSVELDGYLTGMGVRDCFSGLYGPDVVNTPKEGRAYYERIFAHAGVRPVDAVVVDDNALVLSWAASTGARTILVNSNRDATEIGVTVISALRELPTVIGAG